MAAKRSDAQLREVAAFVTWLYDRSPAATWAEFATLAGVHPVQLSKYQTAKSCPDGYNLLNLIRAAGVLDDPTLTQGPGDQARLDQGLATIERVRKLLDAQEERLRSDRQGQREHRS